MGDVKLDEDWLWVNERYIKKNSLIAIYTTEFFSVIKSGLRDGLYTSLAKTIADYIVKSIEESPPYPDKICLYRGLRDNPYLYENLKIGDEVIFKEFASTTTSIQIAEKFTARTKNDKNRRAPILVLCFPKNSKFLYVAPISQSPDEKEVLPFPGLIATYLGRTEVDPTLGDYKHTFQIKGHVDISNMEANSDFDYRYLFYLTKFREIVPRRKFLSTYFWDTSEYPNFYEKYETLTRLTDLWGYSEDFIEELDELMDRYDIKERDMVHIFQFYISYLFHLNDPSIKIETGPIKLYRNHTNFLSFDYDVLRSKPYFGTRFKSYYGNISGEELKTVLQTHDLDRLQEILNENSSDDIREIIIESLYGNLIPVPMYTPRLALLEMFYRSADYHRLSSRFSSPIIRLVSELKGRLD